MSDPSPEVVEVAHLAMCSAVTISGVITCRNHGRLIADGHCPYAVTVARVAEAAALRAAAVRVHSLVAVADRQGDLDHPPGLMLARAVLDMTAYDLEASDD